MANPKAKKRRKLVVLLLIVLVLGGLGALAIFKKREAVITIQTEKATRRSLTELVVANGRIQPVFQVKISPEVSGEIIELPVKEGQRVKKGDLLLKIKPDMYVAQRSSSEASYKSALSGRLTAEANLRKAELDLQRAVTLHDSKLLPDVSGVENVHHRFGVVRSCASTNTKATLVRSYVAPQMVVVPDGPIRNCSKTSSASGSA